MKFKQCVIVLVCCMFSGIAVAAAPDAGGEAGKDAKPAPMSKAMQEMVGKDCPEYSAARGDDGRELECAKGKWRAVAQDGSTTAKMRACRFRCKTTYGVEICKGNGPQCDGKTPPHW